MRINVASSSKMYYTVLVLISKYNSILDAEAYEWRARETISIIKKMFIKGKTPKG